MPTTLRIGQFWFHFFRDKGLKMSGYPDWPNSLLGIATRVLK